MGRSKDHIQKKTNTQVYGFMFLNGTAKKYTTNVIAEAMYSHTDSDGKHFFTFIGNKGSSEVSRCGSDG